MKTLGALLAIIALAAFVGAALVILVEITKGME